MAVAVSLLAASPLSAQERKSKIPLADKVIPTGPTHQAFTGKVASLDFKRHLLNVNTVEGQSYEVFPFKKNVKVSKADGERASLESLAPGTSVMVYYEQKGDRRTVQEIVVLTPATEQKTKKAPPHS